jgi:hypothetical protein
VIWLNETRGIFALETTQAGAVCLDVSRGMGGSQTLTRHQREVWQIDRRWLVTWVVSFAASLALFFGAYAIYKATGPHPQVTVFLRAVRHEVRWLIPGLKRKRNPGDPACRRDLDHRRHATAGAAPRG